MTYEETLSYMYKQLPMYQREGKSAFKKDLTNIRVLLHHFDNPHNNFQTIHIAGTNGKGTVSHMIAGVLQESGLSVGLYTSPHYMDFRERIKINGIWLPETYVTSWIADNKSVIESVHPSFFEITVAMAFCYFSAQKVDIAVIETGLGGRLDSTNVVTPLLSVITHISLDHQNMLGDTIYQIAGEKAGIIKKNVPVVIGRYQDSCDHVFIQKAKNTSSELSWASLDIESVRKNSETIFKSDRDTYHILNHKYESPFLDENRRTAIAALEKISFDSINNKIMEKGLSNFSKLTNYLGRWQIISEEPLCIADSAHNIDAIKKVMLEVDRIPKNSLYMVIGMVADKDIDNMLSVLPKNAIYHFTKAEIPRALDPEVLAKKASRFDLQGLTFYTVKEAYQSAIQKAKKDDMIYVGGSSFVVGDFLAYLSAT